jgi:uncharacterized protein involved in outer membrane biogenesis
VTIFFQDEVIRFVIENLNQQVNSRIEVQSAHFSLFRKFPNASVEFRNVKMSPVKGFDTLSFTPEYSRHLLVAENVFIQLNLFSILSKDFRITQIDIQHGDIHILTDKNNHHNYLFWKTTQGEMRKNASPVELENVLLTRVNVFYSHKRSNLVFSVFAEKTRFSGRFSTRQYSLDANVSGIVRQLSVGDDLFIRDKTLELSGKLDVNDQIFSIRKANLELAETNMDVSGGFMLADPVDLDLHLEGRRLEYSSLASLLPDKYGAWLQNYPGKGNCHFSADITGPAGKGKKPHVEAQFGMEQASITHRESRNKLTELAFSGTFTTGDRNQRATTVLTIQNFGCRIGNGKLNGSLTVRDFRKPSFAIKVRGNMDMEQLTRFIPAKQLTSVKGLVDGNLSVNMRWKRLSFHRKSDMEQLDVRGTIRLAQVSMRLNQSYQLENINGTLTFDKHISTKNLSFILNKNDFSFNGQFERLFPYLLDKTKTIGIEGKVVSKNLDVFSLLPSPTTSASKQVVSRKNRDTFLFPDHIIFNTSFSAGNIRYRNFTATGLNASLTYQPRSLGIKSIKFTSMAGHFSGNGVLTNRSPDNLRLSGNLLFSDVDIRNAFQTFDHFSQDVLRAEHINGRLSGDFDYSIAWDGKMKLKQDELQAQGDLSLAGGELSHFEPMNNLSRFIALEELQNIRFSTLKTQVSVKNKHVSIPMTQIESSAFNISGSGEHYFDNHYTYRVKILLSELLAAKARKNKKENRDHEYEEDGGKRTAIYLKLEGQGSDFKITYDKQSAKASVAADIKKEKQTLKSILHQEFGWFKKDSTLQETVNPPANTGKLRFSFEEEETPEQEKPAKKAKQKKTTTEEEKIKIEWE